MVEPLAAARALLGAEAVRPLGPDDRAGFEVILATLLKRDGEETYASWAEEIRGLFEAAVFPTVYAGAGSLVFVTGTLAHRVIEYTEGEAWGQVLEALRADDRVEAISLFDYAMAGPATDRLSRAGLRRMIHWKHCTDLMDPPPVPPLPAGFTVESYEPAKADDVSALLASTNWNLDGLFLTFPDLPGPEACTRLVKEWESGVYGRCLPEFSYLARFEGRLVGLVMVTETAPRQAFLLEISVRLRHRGTGLAPHLIARLRSDLRGRNYEQTRFLSCQANRGSWALFDPVRTRSTTIDSGWFWRR